MNTTFRDWLDVTVVCWGPSIVEITDWMDNGSRRWNNGSFTKHTNRFISFLLLHSIICIQVEDECGEIPMVIVQNKIDLVDQAVVDA